MSNERETSLDDDSQKLLDAFCDVARKCVSSYPWTPIDLVPPPTDSEFLAYGFYIYPGDEDRTEYMMVAEYYPNDPWPYSTTEGGHPKDFFSHWMPLPTPPKPSEIKP